MEQAAFEPPLSDGQLKEIGRLVINCGFAEFLLNIHLGMLFEVSDVDAKYNLISPLATRRKVDLLKAGLPRIPTDATRDLVKDACSLVDVSIGARNAILHGIWGFDGNTSDASAIVVSTKKTRGHLKAEDISKCADSLAIASRKLADALLVDGGKRPGNIPERLVIETGH